MRPAVLALFLALLLPGALAGAAGDSPSKAAGLTLKALSGQDLDSIERALGRRAGVLIEEVAADSPAARAALRKGDVLLSVGGAVVASPGAVDLALEGRTGRIALGGFRETEAGAVAVEAVLDLPEAGQADPPKGTAAPSPEAAARPDGGRGRTWRHPIGFVLWIPEGWKTVENDDHLRLLPADPGGTAEAPTEIYFAFAESIAGSDIREAADPRVAAYLDGKMAGIAPFLRRDGKAASAEALRAKGVVLDWRGKNPSGDAVKARAHAVILGEWAVALVALGLEERVAAREGDLGRMFAGLGLEKGGTDPAVVGAWDFLSTYALRNDSPFERAETRASSVSESSRRLVLRADGTFTRTTISRTIVIGAGVSLDSGPEKTVQEGKWNAGDGTLWLRWGDDWSLVARYRIEKGEDGPRLLLAVDGKGEVWQPAR